MNNDTGYMYVWDESTASRGAEEVASALLSHIKSHVNTARLICYSDCCGGQNRNIKVALMWNYIVHNPETTVTEIDHKFLVSGHTYLSNDQDFGLIERNKNAYSDIYVPDDWIRVIETAKKREPKFLVSKLDHSQFCSTKKLVVNAVNRKVGQNGQKVYWLKIQWIHFTEEYPNIMFYKYSNSEEALFEAVDLSKKKVRGRPRSVSKIRLDQLYPSGRAIAKAKILDLKSLLPYIPPVHHEFYKRLKIDSNGDE